MKKHVVLFLSLFFVSANLFGMKGLSEEFVFFVLEKNLSLKGAFIEYLHKQGEEYAKFYEQGGEYAKFVKEYSVLLEAVQKKYSRLGFKDVICYRFLPQAKFYKDWVEIDKCGQYEHGHAYWTKEDVEELLERKENPNQVCHEGYTPLHCCSYWEEEGKELARRLLDAGANPNVKNGRSCPKNTCLHDAALHTADSEWIDLLVKGGAVLDAKNGNGDTVLHLAAYLGHDNIIRYMFSGWNFDFNVKNIYGQTPLFKALESFPRSDTVRILLSLGANPNAQDNFGMPPLLKLLANSNFYSGRFFDEGFKCLCLLLENRADPNISDKNGVSPMRLVNLWFCNHQEVKQRLLAAGATEDEFIK